MSEGHLFFPSAMSCAPTLDPLFRPAEVCGGRILLINPFYRKDPVASFGKHVLTPTLALTSLAGATPDHWCVEYWDENLLQGHPPLDPFPQVVGITVHLTFVQRAIELADWYRSRGAVVVMGGLHGSSCPDELIPHTNALVVGEGVGVWPEVLADIESGNLKQVYRGSFRTDYGLEPQPRRDILDKRSFLTTTSLNATRGCHNRCDFCYLSTKSIHMPYRTMSIQRLVDEIESDGEPYAVFTDNNLGSKPQYLLELCRALRPLEIIWSAAVTIDITDHPDIVREMALAGCTGVFVGFESLGQSNLEAAGKRTPSPNDYGRRVSIFHDNGIQVNGSFVFGFDHDHPDIFDRTVDWCERFKLECATFHILTPYPGTPFFARLEAEGRLLTRDWSLYDTAHVVFEPKHMSAEDLSQGYQRSYARLFSHRSIWRRRPDTVASVPAYLAMSYLYKKSNPLWYWLIRYRLTRAVWRPLLLASRHRHVRFRRQLEKAGTDVCAQIVSAGV